MSDSANQIRLEGFTLAEVLIALALVAAIATFTIPKILQVHQEHRKKLVFREAVYSLHNILHEMRLQKSPTHAEFSAAVLQRVNALKICPTNSQAQGCWNAVQGVDPFTAPSNPKNIYQAGYILHSGANVVGISDATMISAADTRWMNTIYIDWNGVAGPNQLGKDQLYVALCNEHYQRCTDNLLTKSGSFGPVLTELTNPASQIPRNNALFKEIFEFELN